MKLNFGPFFTKVKQHPKNIFSTVAGLKGYKVGRKRFPATVDGKRRAEAYQVVLYRRYGRPVSMHYLYK